VKAVLARVEEIRRLVEGRRPYAAPAARRETAQVAAAGERLRSDPLVKAVLDAYPEPAMLLDGRRQIVAANDGAAAVLATGDARSLLGRRPGEALGCAGPRHGPDGCGTGPGCAYCGLGQMLSEIQQGRATPVQGECRIRRSDGHAGAVEYAFKLTTLAPRGEGGGDGPYLLATFRDMSAENRRRVIERSLVENLLDAASVVRSVAASSSRVATAKAATSRRDVTGLLSEASRTLADEALFHQHLLAAEAGELQPVWEDVDVRPMLVEVSRILRHHPAGAGRRLVIRAPKGLGVRTDRVLLLRAVRGLVRNALEACSPGEVATVEAGPGASGGVEIRVHNPGVMPPAVREQVFRRCFSTKAVEGRGIGLHAARLFVETYLGGRIGFASEDPKGTTFWVRVPSRKPSAALVSAREGERAGS
jgi:PAS domain-containing protein